MSHLEERLQRDLDQIGKRVVDVAQKVERALGHAHVALLTRDKPLAYQTALGDLAINRAIRETDRLCHRFIALHLPSAGHLRYISSVLRMNIGLERIGDYAVTICREVVQLQHPLEGTLRREIERMAEDAIQMYRQAMLSFSERNVELARGTKVYADHIQRALDVAFQDLVEVGSRNGYDLKELFGLLIILNRWERVSDQAKNICEETVFANTGETKPAKTYRVLFLDQNQPERSHMAAAIARKVYPESGRYTLGGPPTDAVLDADFVAWMAQHGHEVEADQRADTAAWPPEMWNDYHVAVSLQGPVEDYVSPVPFQVIALEWDAPLDAGAASANERYGPAYRQTAAQVSELMEALRGEDAA